MKKLEASCWAKTSSILIGVLLIVCGCQSNTVNPPQHEIPSGNNHTGNPPCGTLLIVAPLLNVTGFLTTEANPNSTIYLFVSPDTSFDTSLYVVGNCLALTNQTIVRQTNFTFENLPPGDYIAMVPRDSFPGNVQGFPMIREFNRSNHSVEVNFHGGNWKYSLLSFSLRPSLGESKTGK